MKTFLKALAPALLLAGLIGSSAHAWTITPTLTVNGTDAGVSIQVTHSATGKGRTDYDSWVGPIPIPVNYYVVHTVPWWPFAMPSYVGGNTGPGSFSIGTNVDGSKAYIYSKSALNLGSWTIYTNVTATSDYAYATTQWWTHGTGSGHGADANADVSVKSHN